MPNIRLRDIEAAWDRIRATVVRTPLQEVPANLRPRADLRLSLKLECVQISGSFKARGARHFVARLVEGNSSRGVITYSSGNHGRAVAEAARDAGIPAVVTVPEGVDPSKAAAMQAAGAEVISAGLTSRSRKEAALAVAEERGLEVIPPFDHEWIIAGQATAGLEIIEDVPDLVAVWVPVGGGGLSAGVAAAMTALRPELTVYTVEPVAAAPLAASLAAGQRTELDSTESVADGLLPLAIGERNWDILSCARVVPVTVEEDVILESLGRLHRELEVHAEPSGAVAPAPLLTGRSSVTLDSLPPGHHVAIVSGSNVDPARLERLLE